MLLFDKKLLKTTRLNQIVVPVYSEDDVKQEDDPIGYLYCDLSTYQQAVTLSVRFEDEVDALQNLLIFEVIHSEAINYWKSVVPKPLDMLAPYLGLVTDRIDMTNSIEELAGYMHVLGKSINFANFVAVPKQARVNVSFGKSSFTMMAEELAEYRKTLRERELCENADDVTWVSTEEIARVLVVSNALGINITAGPVNIAPVNTSLEIDTQQLDENALDVKVDLSDSWAGYKPISISTDWDSPSPMVARAIENINEDGKSAEDSNFADDADFLTRMMQGTINSHNV